MYSLTIQRAENRAALLFIAAFITGLLTKIAFWIHKTHRDKRDTKVPARRSG